MVMSERMQRVRSPVIPVVAELVQANPQAISLGQGVVGYAPPAQAMAMIEEFAGAAHVHKYQHVQGIPRLIEAIAKKLLSDNDTAVAGRALVVTAGSNMGFMNAVAAITDPGDEVILLGPYYFNQEMALTIAGCTPVVVATDAQYQPRMEAIEAAISPRTRALVSISPNNPTGAVYPRPALEQLNALCARHGIYHISDEAYEYFTYAGARHFSPGSLPGSVDHTISLYSLSKAYGLASWRVGYMVVPEALLEAIKKFQDTNLICAPVISQYVALGALQAGIAYCQARLQDIAAVRSLVLDALLGLGGRVVVPRAEGAFYVLLKVQTDLDAMVVVRRLIEEHGVAVIPGTAFGLDDGCYLRIAYGALDADTVTQGMGRLVDGLEHICTTGRR